MNASYQNSSEFEAAHSDQPLRCLVEDDKASVYALNPDGSLGELLFETRVSQVLASHFAQDDVHAEWTVRP